MRLPSTPVALVLAALLAAPAGVQDPLPEIPRLTGPIELDGRIDEPA